MSRLCNLAIEWKSWGFSWEIPVENWFQDMTYGWHWVLLCETIFNKRHNHQTLGILDGKNANLELQEHKDAGYLIAEFHRVSITKLGIWVNRTGDSTMNGSAEWGYLGWVASWGLMGIPQLMGYPKLLYKLLLFLTRANGARVPPSLRNTQVWETPKWSAENHIVESHKSF